MRTQQRSLPPSWWARGPRRRCAASPENSQPTQTRTAPPCPPLRARAAEREAARVRAEEAERIARLEREEQDRVEEAARREREASQTAKQAQREAALEAERKVARDTRPAKPASDPLPP